MHRIRFAFCALVLIGMAAPAAAQGPIRNFLRSRRANAGPQYVAPTGPVSPAPAVIAGTPATTGVIAGPVAATGSTTTARYAPATTETVPASVTVGTTVAAPEYVSMQNNGRRGLFGRRRRAEAVVTTPAPMIVPATVS